MDRLTASAGMIFILVGGLMASCSKSPLSSVCLPNGRPDVDAVTLMVLLQPKLPEGATVTPVWSSDQPERRIVQYRNRASEVSVRPNGTGACFDFSPPIVMDAPEPGKAQIRWEDRAARLLTDYWYLPVIFVGTLFLWRSIERRTRLQNEEVTDRGHQEDPSTTTMDELKGD